MTTLEIKIDETVLADVDESLSVLHQNREDFFRDVIERSAAKLRREAEVAKQYREAYSRNPIEEGEFSIDEDQLIEAWKDLPWEP